eukprot:gnl/TRDRNA2_/TRDRNA2_160787_c1_seq1.p1 gnl/TRDRNA2_/TRDRNA2_160787_c1~~gnl/TRDRNA2_/TRDRNA2_160787_c1_seq1.p1  ORF type:complete len:212 (-),score=33.39 gnl/TRDRNA2_/TRDRNA2_160787_c1_seq1:59-646(-)
MAAVRSWFGILGEPKDAKKDAKYSFDFVLKQLDAALKLVQGKLSHLDAVQDAKGASKLKERDDVKSVISSLETNQQKLEGHRVGYHMTMQELENAVHDVSDQVETQKYIRNAAKADQTSIHSSGGVRKSENEATQKAILALEAVKALDQQKSAIASEVASTPEDDLFGAANKYDSQNLFADEASKAFFAHHGFHT